MRSKLMTEDFDSCPIDEQCMQVGTPNYNFLGRLEAEIYKRQLERIFPELKIGGLNWLRVKENPHDFGYYYSVRLFYEDEQVFLKIESELPDKWDEEAKTELRKLENYPFPI